MGLLQSKILGTGMYVPKKVVTNFDLEKTLNTSDKWIYERTGIKQRHISSSEGGEYPSDMALHATQDALAMAGLKPNDIDIILFATLTPDYRVPNTASILQTKLGITNQCACLDMNAACTGFVYGHYLAHSMIQTGMAKNVLLLGGELLSQEVDWQERTVSILCGDGCGAAVIGPAREGDESQFLGGYLGADGTGREFFLHETGGSARPITEEILRKRQNFMTMRGKELFKVATRTLANNARKVLEKTKVRVEEIDWMVPHQANLRIIEKAGDLLNFPREKIIINVEKYGNTSAGTVPIALHEAIGDGRIKRGDLVLLNAFGAGLTFGANLIRF
ncbi:MAG: ketoacyl-ACP synthase III [Halobacteriovoraceae bacterium]|nr:ketoacyl-ACP synthase III [Halobacteriovoraceae bacterium]